jgi:2-keto-3-deoxy-L-rhamnonate aldolase RhmA
MTAVLQDETLASVLRRGGAIGSWCGFASFCSVEAMTLCGFDFLVLDMQHTEIAQSHFPACLGPSVRGAPGRSSAPPKMITT